jgi:hypothetical protein
VDFVVAPSAEAHESLGNRSPGTSATAVNSQEGPGRIDTMRILRKLALAVISGCLVLPACAGADVLLGAFANQNGKAFNFASPADSESNLLAVEKAAGRKLAIDSQYITWDGFSAANPPLQMQWDARNGRTPHLTWKFNMHSGGARCANWKDIVSGAYDTQLRDQAKVLAALKTRVIIRLWPNMDQRLFQCVYDVDPTADVATGAQHFIQAWQHIVTLVRGIAPKVEWNWSPNLHAFTDNRGNPSTNWKRFYPGDRYVDWVGTQIYNNGYRNMTLDGDPMFRAFYAAASSTGKKIIFSETGAPGPDPQVDAAGHGCPGARVNASPSPQVTWIDSFRTDLPKYKEVKAVIYFSGAAGNVGPERCDNFILRGDGLSAFSKLANDPYFSTH